MSEWKEVLIDNLCEVTSSKRIFYEEYVTSGIPFFRSKEIIELSNKQMVSTDLFITKEKFDSINDKFGAPAKDDILLTSVGTLGIPYLVPGTFDFYFKDGNLTWFRKWKNEINPLFFYWWLKSPLGYQALLDISIGSTQQALTISGLKGISFLLPPLPEQERIAEILSSLDDKIDLLHRNNKTLEQLAETLFRQWFVEEAEESWEEGVLDDICSRIGSGGTPPTKDNTNYNGIINWYSTKELNDSFLFNSISKITEQGLNSSSAKLFPKGTVVMAIYAAPTVGRLGILSNEATFNQAACGFIPNNKSCTEFIYLFLKSQRDELNLMATGSAQQNLNVGKVRNYPLLLPPEQKMNNFKKQVNILFTKIESNQIQIQQLETLRDTLLPKLMSGVVRVEE